MAQIQVALREGGESLEKMKLFVSVLPSDGSTLKKGQRGPVVSPAPSFMNGLQGKELPEEWILRIFGSLGSVHLTDPPSRLDACEQQSLTGPRGLILYQHMSSAPGEEYGHLSPHDSELEMKT